MMTQKFHQIIFMMTHWIFLVPQKQSTPKNIVHVRILLNSNEHRRVSYCYNTIYSIVNFPMYCHGGVRLRTVCPKMKYVAKSFKPNTTCCILYHVASHVTATINNKPKPFILLSYHQASHSYSHVLSMLLMQL